VVFTRWYRPADGPPDGPADRPPDGPGLCPVSVDVSGVCPWYVRGMSDVCPPDGESRTQRRTEGVTTEAMRWGPQFENLKEVIRGPSKTFDPWLRF